MSKKTTFVCGCIVGALGILMLPLLLAHNEDILLAMIQKLMKQNEKIIGEQEKQQKQMIELQEKILKMDEKIARLEVEIQKWMVNYSLPADIWNNCRYQHEGEWILDMSTDSWCNLSVSDQQKYAKMYQEGYAKAKGLELEKTFPAAGANIVMRLIPPGRFWMGSPEGEKDRSLNEKMHRVVISKAYYLGKYEVTQAQWKAVMGENPSRFQNAGLDAPVEDVSWNDCKSFCEKTGLALPTEAQWEYACRGGVTRPYYWGDDMDDSYCWYTDNSGWKTHPVGEKKPNAFGLYDMLGNVWEWCEDSCDWNNGVVTDTYVDGISDPVCRNGSYRVFRGGSWYSYSRYLRSAGRGGYSPDDRDNDLGFRCSALAGVGKRE